jgi:hypothetical protein
LRYRLARARLTPALNTPGVMCLLTEERRVVFAIFLRPALPPTLLAAGGLTPCRQTAAQGPGAAAAGFDNVFRNDSQPARGGTLRRMALIKQRLVAVFLGGLVLLHSPVISIFNQTSQWCGIPVLYLYLFTVWAVLIAAMAWISEKQGE